LASKLVKDLKLGFNGFDVLVIHLILRVEVVLLSEASQLLLPCNLFLVELDFPVELLQLLDFAPSLSLLIQLLQLIGVKNLSLLPPPLDCTLIDVDDTHLVIRFVPVNISITAASQTTRRHRALLTTRLGIRPPLELKTILNSSAWLQVRQTRHVAHAVMHIVCKFRPPRSILRTSSSAEFSAELFVLVFDEVEVILVRFAFSGISFDLHLHLL
jgi:hypothetical protein